MFEVSGASAAFSFAQIEFNVSVGGRGEGDFLRDLGMKRCAPEVGVKDNAGGIHDHLQTAATMLLQFMAKSLHQLIEINVAWRLVFCWLIRRALSHSSPIRRSLSHLTQFSADCGHDHGT